MNSQDHICRFLDTLSLQRRVYVDYACMVREFNQFEAASSEGATVETLRAWLLRRIRRSSLQTVVHRTQRIIRYLQWRADTEGTSHPLLELRKQYGNRLRPIVQALLQDDFESALQMVKPLPKWGSVLGPVMREHVARMQSLGYRYVGRTRELQRFDRFLQRHPELASAPLAQQVEAWGYDRRGVQHQYRAQQCGQMLSKALRRKDARTPILQMEAGLHRRTLQQNRRPYLYTEAEVERLLETALAAPSKRAPLRPSTHHAMITLAYCAGLRIGEIAALRLGDLDGEAGELEIRQTKFFKSRRLPLSPSALGVLLDYREARAATGAPLSEDAPLWWSPQFRCGYSRGSINVQMIALLRRAGFKPERGRRGPRFHDLRHTFVAHRMLQWYREGIDPQSHLPYLATYLGHKDIRSTLVYLQITPELLQQASERYRRGHAGLLRSPGGAS